MILPRLLSRLSLLLFAALLSACALAPRAGPTGGAVDALGRAEGPPVRLVALDAAAVAALAGVDAAEAARAAALRPFAEARPVQGERIRVGDLVEITIWEAVGGGLFSAGTENGPRASRLPPQRVDERGRISAPYAGSLRAAGRTPAQLSAAVTAALEGKAIQPQAMAVVLDSPGAAATVIGDAAARPGRVPLHGVGERLLDVVAAAGGVKTPAHQARVALVREGASGEAWFDEVIADPARNVAILPGDTVALTETRRGYSVFGATLRPIRADFPRARVTLDEALSQAGGLDDDRAEPASVYVFRQERPDALAALGLPGGAGDVVYNLDLSRPEAFFDARRFAMRDKDVIYVANAPATDLRKVLSVIGSALSPASRSVGLAGQF